MSINPPNRNPRMVAKQKDELLRLLEMYFIRKVGRAVDVNNIKIDKESWKIFAQNLNECGPTKHVDEWEKSFYFMKLRVKTKKDQLLRRCNESGRKLKLQDFLDSDQKIIQMFYPDNISTDEETGLSLENSYNQNQVSYSNEPNQISQSNDQQIPQSNDQQISQANDQQISQSNDQQISVNESDNGWFVIPEVNEEQVESFTENGARITRFVSLYNSEDVSEFVEFIDPLNHQPEQREPASSSGQLVHSELTELIDSSPTTNQQSPSHQERVASCRQMAQHGSSKRKVARRGRLIRCASRSVRGGRKRIIVRRKQSSRVNRARVVRRRITDIQRHTLLDLVQKNFLRTVGRYSGFNGVVIKKRLWAGYTQELNALGPPTRTPKEWKNIFTNIRLRAKKKIANIRHDRSRLGGEEKVAARLSDMDDQILSMYGIDILDGQQKLGEGGFPYKKTLPYRNNPLASIEMTESDDVRVFFDDNVDDEDFDYQIGADPVNVRSPSRHVNVLSNELILPAPNLLDEIHQESEQFQTNKTVSVSHHNEDIESGRGQLYRETSVDAAVLGGEIEKQQPFFEQGQTSRDTSINVPLSQAQQRSSYEQGQSSRDTSINVPLPQALQRSSIEQGQSSLDTSINVPLSEAKNKPNQLVQGRTKPGPTANRHKNIAVSVAGMTQAQLDENPVNRRRQAADAQRDRSEIRSNGNSTQQQPAVNQTRNATASQTHTGRGRNARAQASTGNQPIDRQARDGDRTRYRNEHTSYAMVERSYNAQVRMNEQIDRNHNEMVYMFTLALREIASAIRDHFNGNQ